MPSINIEAWQRFSAQFCKIDALKLPEALGRIDGHTVAQRWMGHTGSNLCSVSVQAVPPKPDLIWGSGAGAARSLK